MKNLQSFEDFINEDYSIRESIAPNLEYWKDYEKDTSMQGDKEDEDHFTDASKLTPFIKSAINKWDDNADEDNLVAKNGSIVADVNAEAKAFFKKFDYINVNIIHAMIAQA